MNFMRCFGLLFAMAWMVWMAPAWLFAGQAPRNGPVVTHWPDGKKRVEAIYRNGKLNGAYKEYHGNGKLKVSAFYAQGKRRADYKELSPEGKVLLWAKYQDGLLEGNHRTFYSNGKKKREARYARGLQHGPFREYNQSGKLLKDQIFIHGVVGFPRTLLEIRREIARLDGAASRSTSQYAEKPVLSGKLRAGALSQGILKASLGRLKVYRYLAELAYKDVKLNKAYCVKAQHATVLLAQIGKLSHTPSKPPGMSDAFFKLGYAGTSKSNLHQGQGTVVGAVDGFMDDSDPSNISRLGHRRWCLDPKLGQIGLGAAKGFVALYVVDGSRRNPPDYDYVVFPGRGYHPLKYFPSNAAWSVSLNPAKYAEPIKGKIKVNVFPLDARYQKARTALALDYQNVSTVSFGIRYALIFRPKGLKRMNGATYLVEIEGVKSKAGKDAPIRYVVSFVK